VIPERREGDPRAEALRGRHSALFGGPQVPVPVESIAADLLGLHVEELEGLEVSGMLVAAERTIRLNAVEARETPGRRRFTLAHEIAHWVCHCPPNRPVQLILCRPAQVGVSSGDAMEREANVFAAELLMPETEVTAAIALGAGVGELAARFGVSEVALAWRLFNLGLAERPPA
jgi:Zn-dependent peptidase ImmA (M78 family)